MQLSRLPPKAEKRPNGRILDTYQQAYRDTLNVVQKQDATECYGDQSTQTLATYFQLLHETLQHQVNVEQSAHLQHHSLQAHPNARAYLAIDV